MATQPLPLDRLSRRMAMVEEHIRLENVHDLDGVIATFGDRARYDDEPWNEHHEGHEGVRHFYAGIMAALPDLSIQVMRRHISDETIVLEGIIRGTQHGAWRGLPPTGRKIEFPLCGIFTFCDDDRLAGERIYYDRASILRQLGVFHEPATALGRIGILFGHPITMLRALAGKSR